VTGLIDEDPSSSNKTPKGRDFKPSMISRTAGKQRERSKSFIGRSKMPNGADRLGPFGFATLYGCGGPQSPIQTCSDSRST
jgi:hypothetical protein